MKKEKFIFHPHDAQEYIDRLQRAFTRAHESVVEGNPKAKEPDPVLLKMIDRQPEAVLHEEMPLSLKALAWSCEENCRYACMQENSMLRISLNEPVVQYYGKWPFTRVWGIQELLSSLFSFLNGVPYALLLISQRRLFSSGVRTARTAWMCGFWCVIASNTWLQSTLFHARDSPLTEALDYHGASLYLHVSLSTSLFMNMPVYWPLWFSCGLSYFPVLAFWTYHILYLSLVHFDYGYNMQVVVGAGIAASTFWSIWFFRVRKDMLFAWKVMVASWGPYLVLPLELLDFPPYLGIVDAHAIWHLLTIPLAFVLCSFMKDVVTGDVKRSLEKVE